jgi:hypothetical protein
VRNGTVPASDGIATGTLAATTGRVRPAPVSERAILRWLVRAVQVGLAGLILAWFVSQSFYDHAADFKTFFSAGYAVRHPEVPLYDLVALDENPFGEVFKLAPSAAVYLVPFSYGTIQQARLIWRCVLVATMLIAYGALMHTLRFGTFGWVWLVGLAAWSAFGPLQIAVGEGQWDPVLLLVVSLATVAVFRQRNALAAIAFAFGASIKPYPLILAGYFVARRRWAAASVTAVAFGGLTLLGVLVVGLDEAAAFVARVLPASGATTAYADNQSLGGVVARAWTSDLKPFPLANAWPVDLMIRVSAVVLCALTVWLVARRPGVDPMQRALQLGLFVPLSILVIPAAWTHYQAILLVPLTLLAVEQARNRPRDVLGWAALAVAYAVLMLPNPTMLYGPEIDRGLWLRSRVYAANLALERLYPTMASRQILSFKAFAVIFLFGFTAWRVVRPSSRIASQDTPAGLPISARVPA